MIYTNIWIQKERIIEEEFEDTNGAIWIGKSKKDRKHNGQKKKDTRTNNDLQNTMYKTKDLVSPIYIRYS